MASETSAVWKDLTAGTVAGVVQLFVGHPFDTIKVKLQSQPKPLPGQSPLYKGAIDAVQKTIAAEGPRGLFKGMGAPLATVAVFNAVLFTARGQMEALLRAEPGATLSVGQQMVAGAGAGVASALVACPTELVKCRLQAQSVMATAPVAAEPLLAAAGVGLKGAGVGAGAAAGAAGYGGPMDVARTVLRTEGGVRGLYKGLGPTLLREVPGNAAMFGVYELTKRALAGGEDTSKLSQGALMASGGLAGAFFWLSVYPADVIKSMIQVDSYTQPKYRGTLDAFQKVYATEGTAGLFRGFGPAMARSVPANAVTFLAYEMVRSKLG